MGDKGGKKDKEKPACRADAIRPVPQSDTRFRFAVLDGTARFTAIADTPGMSTLGIRRSTLEALDIDIRSWLRYGLAAMVIAACAIVFATRVREGPVLVTGVSEATGSEAQSYVELRHRVEATLPALRVTEDAAEILGREAGIGSAVRAARRGAVQGAIFTAAVTENVRLALAADVTRRSASDWMHLMSEVPAMPPRINELYPTGEALATFPPLLLQALPELPIDFEYRFMGRHLVVRDSRTNLIVDYLPDAPISTAVAP